MITFTRLLWLLMFLFASFNVNIFAQVTIGDGAPPSFFSVLEISTATTKGGLRLPHLNNEERDKIITDIQALGTTEKAVALKAIQGLTIFNTETICLEYWDSKRWISLCEGNSSMVIGPDPCLNISSEGTSVGGSAACDQEFHITDPDCPGGPFTFAIVAGSEYSSFAEINETEGIFKLNVQANNSVNPRTIVVRVTSGCTGLYKDFLFGQDGQSCAALGTAPSITSFPAGKDIQFCAGGAVYLSVPKSTPDLDQLIWTRNGVEVARGVNFIAASSPGIYNVYMGLIGCGELSGNAVKVSRNGTGAPAPVQIVVRGNNGLVCGTSGTTKLIAQKTSGAGTIRWFKDGQLVGLTSPDNEVMAGIGEWIAVVFDGATCQSLPSEAVIVSEDPSSGGSLVLPIIKKSGTFCAGSAVLLSVETPEIGYTYTWYENNTILGKGTQIMYNVPTDLSDVIIRCQASISGSCSSEAIQSESITVGDIPSRPNITGSFLLCSGIGTLNVVPVDGSKSYTYAWYDKNNQLLGTAQSLNITKGGDYYAMVTEVGGCSSPLAYRNISDISSAKPTVTLARSIEQPNLDDQVTYMANIDFGPATKYEWEVTNAIIILGGGDSPNAVVKFNQTGPASVTVTVSNLCGSGVATHTIANVVSACADVTAVYPSSNKKLTTIVNSGVTLGPVSADFSAGSPAASYQWYVNTTESNTGGAIISGQTANTLVVNQSAAGNYYYYCVVKNAANCGGLDKASAVYTVKVNINPSTMTNGLGTLTGKTCFDVVESNQGGACSSLSSRQSVKSDFSQTATNTQVYKFKSSGIVSKIRFIYVNVSGDIIEDVLYDETLETATNLNGEYQVAVKFRSDLNRSSSQNGAGGLTREQALKAKLFVVYNNLANGMGEDRKLELNLSVQDCLCCPGYLSVGGEYTRSGYFQGVPGFNNLGSELIYSFFTATGRDVCFFEKDTPNTTNSFNSHIFSSAVTLCSNGTGVGSEFGGIGGWRLPTLGELNAIAPVAGELANHPNSTPTTTNLKLTGGSYWSGTETNISEAWVYSFSARVGGSLSKAQYKYIRCVRTF